MRIFLFLYFIQSFFCFPVPIALNIIEATSVLKTRAGSSNRMSRETVNDIMIYYYILTSLRFYSL